MSEHIKPFEIDLSGLEVRLFPDGESLEAYEKRYPRQVKKLGVMAVYLFRTTPDVNYIRSYFAKTEEEIYVFNQQEMARWICGFALTPEDEKELRLSNRNNGSFRSQLGWNPPVLARETASDREQELYAGSMSVGIDEEWAHLLDDEEEDE